MFTILGNACISATRADLTAAYMTAPKKKSRLMRLFSRA